MNKNVICLVRDVRNILREQGSWSMLKPLLDTMVRFDVLDEPTILVEHEEFVHGMTKLIKKISKLSRVPRDIKKRLERDLKLLDSNGYVSNTDLSIFDYEKTPTTTETDDIVLVTEMYEKERKRGQIETIPDVLDLLRRLSEYEISIENSDIHESMRTEMLRSKDGDIAKSATNLLSEYNNESESAINRVMDMCKDPSRQKLAEKVQKNAAKDRGVFLDKLPDGGIKSIRILNHYFRYFGDLSIAERESSTKSMDFKIQNSLDEVFLYCKYTKEEGGSQDNIKSDIKLVIDQFGTCTHAKLLIVLDGGYWDKKRTDFMIKNDNIMIISSDEYNNSKVSKFMNLK